MPRKGAKGKWNMKMSPDEWYWKEDPWDIINNEEELLKMALNFKDMYDKRYNWRHTVPEIQISEDEPQFHWMYDNIKYDTREYLICLTGYKNEKVYNVGRRKIVVLY